MGFIQRINLRLNPADPEDVELERLIKRLRAGARHRKIKEVLRLALKEPNAGRRRGPLSSDHHISRSASVASTARGTPASVPFDPREMVSEMGNSFMQPWSTV